MGHTFQVSSLARGATRAFSVINRGDSSSFVRAKSHRCNKARRARQQRAQVAPRAHAATDNTIQPHSCKPIPVHADFARTAVWFADKTVLGQADGSCLLTTPTLIDANHAFIAVSNPTDRPVGIQRGEALSQLHDPATYFSRGDEAMQAHAGAVRALVQERIAQDRQSNPDVGEEQWGPKAAKLPDLTTYPATQMDELLNIGPEWPQEEQVRLLDMLHSRQLAFAFDGRLGHNETAIEIKTAAGSRPISLPMYAASPAKREVIDKQHDAWLAMDVIEPSTSPWAAPVLIAYRNGKPRFCVDYRRLNAV